MSTAMPDRIGVFSDCLPGWSARRVIDVAVALGFTMVEWGCGPGHAIEDPAAGAEIRELCDRAGVASSGVAVQDPDVTLASPKRAAGHLALAAALGAPHIRLMAPPYAGGTLRREQQRARDGVGLLVDLAAADGVAVLVETSPKTLAPAPELAAILVEDHAPELAGVLYDPGNMAIEGQLAPALTIARLGRYLRHVHVKNISWHRDGEGWRWRHASLTGGLLHWPSIVEELSNAGYTGLFSIDHLAGRVSVDALSSESDFLRNLVTEAFGAAAPTPLQVAGEGS
jgi:sugar phosphate isomerase/epimerase